MMIRLFLGSIIAMALSAATIVQAQVVREADVKSIAGLLGDQIYDDYSFRSNGSAILFADVDGDVYQTRGRSAHDEPSEEGGCGDEGGGGPGGFCLQVFNSLGELLCWADRPTRPGWQRDPRLACPLSSNQSASYTLRVALRGEGENPCRRVLYNVAPPAEAKPYLLSVSLRKVAPQGPLDKAVGQSQNTFPGAK